MTVPAGYFSVKPFDQNSDGRRPSRTEVLIAELNANEHTSLNLDYSTASTYYDIRG